MKNKIENLIKEILKNLNIEDTPFSIEHPEDFNNGDYSTNVAMVCAKRLKTNPKELAEKIVNEINTKKDLEQIEKAEVAGPGFINFYLSREFFTNTIDEILKQGQNWGKNETLAGKKVMVEYTQPNPFKPFHIGHLMSNAIGESISRIVEFSGAKTIRSNYQGDIGPHVAKSIYGLMKFGLPEESKSVSEQAQYIGECYSKANNLYESNEKITKEIDEINQKIYDKSDEKINKIYDWGRKVTLEAFEEIYKILGTKFDKYYFESEVAITGEKIVRQNIGKIFEESNEATIFHGEKYDPKLHTRVFITSQKLPTYETKELGLTLAKFRKNLFSKKLDLSIVITAIEQAEYMKVVQKAISIMHPELEKRMLHITHGMMRLVSGKMSSRKGNIITGESLLLDSMNLIRKKIADRELNKEEKDIIARQVGVSALKYSILRSSLGSDIIYNFEKSISFEGDSGPYLQYTAVRAKAIMDKAKEFDSKNKNEIPKEITELEKLIYQFEEVVKYSHKLLGPHHVAIYLTNLASVFNAFYNNTKILDEKNKFMIYQLNLVKAFYLTMKNGLWLLGIETPKKM